ncbi:hypothetical protein FJY94_02355 [Candidatus Kaiserbacteria bacterium]|nr:hypothetical protein [Candidatus Kaiserbacteria bacterium]
MDDEQVRQWLLTEGLDIVDIDLALKLKDAIVRCDTIAFPDDAINIVFTLQHHAQSRETWAGYITTGDKYLITVPQIDILLRNKTRQLLYPPAMRCPSTDVVTEADLALVLLGVGVHEVRHRIQHKKPWVARFARPYDVSDRDVRALTQHMVTLCRDNRHFQRQAGMRRRELRSAFGPLEVDARVVELLFLRQRSDSDEAIERALFAQP